MVANRFFQSHAQRLLSAINDVTCGATNRKPCMDGEIIRTEISHIEQLRCFWCYVYTSQLALKCRSNQENAKLGLNSFGIHINTPLLFHSCSFLQWVMYCLNESLTVTKQESEHDTDMGDERLVVELLKWNKKSCKKGYAICLIQRFLTLLKVRNLANFIRAFTVTFVIGKIKIYFFKTQQVYIFLTYKINQVWDLHRTHRASGIRWTQC